MALLTDYKDLLKKDTDFLSPTGAIAPLQIAPNKLALGGSTPGAQAYTPRAAPTLINFNAQTLPAGGTMDWQNIITSNPGYMQWALGAGERADTATANRKAAMRALAIRFGGLPSNFSDIYGDIDPETAKLAADNPESESARLLRNYQTQLEQSRRALAARGGLSSGELGYGQGQLDLQRQGDVYDLSNKYLDTFSSTLGDYSNTIAGLNTEQIQQLRDAADRIAQDRLYQQMIDAAKTQPVWQGPTDGGGTTGETQTVGGVTGPTTYDPNDPNSPWNKYTWGGQSAKQTYDALINTGIYTPEDAERLTFQWMRNIGTGPDKVYGQWTMPTTIQQFHNWRTTGGF